MQVPLRLLAITGLVGLALAKTSPPGEDPKFPFQVPPSDASRSPCPMLNALANHGYLPREGKNIKMKDFTTAFTTALNFDEKFITGVAETGFTISTTGKKDTLNLKDLEKHDVIEHDASLSRADVAVTGDANKFDAAIWNAVKAHFTSDTIDTKTMAKARADRVKAAMSSNPSLRLSEKQVGITFIEPALVLGVLAGDFKNPKAPTKYMNILFEQERIPFSEGFQTSKTKITEEMIMGLAGEIKKATPKAQEFCS
ncbi:putative sterigmatocystin biosynthesis peroxidase stcC [Colletotrichum orbiculare MAFF 240422]|uniref:Sterigmatocystin biosynthesis peroxidase stcC n=1 Tax=Colletotrichum orbiculare (strain 104-T / ATCC 96160 / CBS 514.97 / LARS 414 / MAFF 240422) TaxID=1213857 RepID=N4UXS2_COLOR|nr:putative sterigmatocystin biosynthesis peroxidase stcC [Colletotrichum orbiculare MAFF 240422]